jgi:hypothetical protein
MIALYWASSTKGEVREWNVAVWQPYRHQILYQKLPINKTVNKPLREQSMQEDAKIQY